MFVADHVVAREVAPELRNVVRRLSRGRRLAVTAGAALLERTSATMLIVVPGEPRLPPSFHGAGAALSAACAAGVAGSVRTDPTFVLDLMDNLVLAAITIATAFQGDGVALGAAAGALREGMLLGRERLDAGAAAVALVAAGEEVGAAVLLRPGAGVRTIVSIERQGDDPSIAEPGRPLADWLTWLDSVGVGLHRRRVADADVLVEVR